MLTTDDSDDWLPRAISDTLLLITWFERPIIKERMEEFHLPLVGQG